MLFRFRDFTIYKGSRAYRGRIYTVSRVFPSHEQFGLTSQMRRAMNSVLLNIAEGSNRSSDIDFGRFLNQAVTSLEEVVACLDIALDERYVSAHVHAELLAGAETLGKQLIAFGATLKRIGALKFQHPRTP